MKTYIVTLESNSEHYALKVDAENDTEAVENAKVYLDSNTNEYAVNELDNNGVNLVQLERLK